MTSQPSSDLCVGVTTHDPDPDLFSVFERQRAWPLLSVPDHDHIFSRDQRTHRPLRDACQTPSLSLRRSPRHRRQRHPNLTPRNPRMSHSDTSTKKMSRSPSEAAANYSPVATQVR